MDRSTPTAEGLDLVGDLTPQQHEIASAEALNFVATLEREFRGARKQLLEDRRTQARQWDEGWRPDFLSETREQRESTWQIASTPGDLQDRRVEINGTTELDSIIRSLNSNASTFVADFGDFCSPTWDNCIQGHLNLTRAVNGNIESTDPVTGETSEIQEPTSTLIVRPRGWHLNEKHLLVDGEATSASLFDFGLFLFHNAKALIKRGSGPYFYLPKLESHREARLWNEIFIKAQELLGLDSGTIKATVQIATLPAAFEMDEILFELRDHVAGLAWGRWDFVFSFIKKHRKDPTSLLPDRESIDLDGHFLGSSSQLLIQTCHRRGAHALGATSMQAPGRVDAIAQAESFEQLRIEKRREAREGFDGSGVIHPDLVDAVRAEFDETLQGAPNQLDVIADEVQVQSHDLLDVPQGHVTEAGIRANAKVGLRYLAAWLCGQGWTLVNESVAVATTAELARAQLWQWLHHGARLDDGRFLDSNLLTSLLHEEGQELRRELGAEQAEAQRLSLATELFEELVLRDGCVDYFTTFASPYLA